MEASRLTFRTASDSTLDRTRRIVFISGIIGVISNMGLFIAYLAVEGWNLEMVASNMFYNAILGILIVASYGGRLFNVAVPGGVLSIFGFLWITSLIDVSKGLTTVLDLPVLLAVPLCLVLVSGYRTLIVLACVQAICVYTFVPSYLPLSYGFNWTEVERMTYAAAVAALAFLTLGLMAIVAYLRERTDKRLLQLVQEKEKLANEDPLTGLLNRRAFTDRVRALIASGQELTFGFIDLDRFKPLNDAHGHAMGDAVLCAIAERLRTFDGVSVCARIGGDEFVLVASREDILREPKPFFKRLRNHICLPVETQVGMLDVGASIGFVATSMGCDVDRLMHAADTAMMRTKSNGGGVAQFDEGVDSYRFNSSVMEARFRAALRNGEFKPALQPIVDSVTRETVGFELLARWTDSGFDVDPTPTEFIPIAEKLGLMNDLLLQLLEATIAGWDETSKFISVNVSTSQLGNYTFLSEIKSLLGRNAIPTSSIQLEITESVSYRDVEANIATLERARRDGFVIALDDFGTGYSSLAILDQLPLDKIKLDQSFVRQRRSGSMTHLVAATIDLANRLNLKCCVEGIEDGLTAYHVASLGCHELQGYYFGRPDIVSGKTVIAEAS